MKTIDCTCPWCKRSRAREADLARLQRIEAAARAVLDSGQARYDEIGPLVSLGPSDPVYVGDFVPATEMAALRAAVEATDEE